MKTKYYSVIKSDNKYVIPGGVFWLIAEDDNNYLLGGKGGSFWEKKDNCKFEYEEVAT